LLQQIKLPIHHHLSIYKELRQLALAKGKAKFNYETNVGAALPVIRTLKDLLTTGDKLEKIEGNHVGIV
jgi:aspartokinase/homoserine dehydrogenase 1